LLFKGGFTLGGDKGGNNRDHDRPIRPVIAAGRW
jgi:hypothetical protein